VAYRVTTTDGAVREIRSPQDLPEPNKQLSLEEPYVRAMIIAPAEYTGAIMELVQSRRGELDHLHYLSPERVELVYQLPLADVVFDFFDAVKSRSRGYASLDYEPSDYRPSDLVRVDILLNEQPVDAFSTITHRDKAAAYGRRMVERLRELIPRQLFDVPVQAASGGRIIARETIKARRKDVTAKCYGGDITRKRKLLERQKEGKKRMKMVGSVEVPQEAFIAALKVES
jgi:GTP-binding protein LepA